MDDKSLMNRRTALGAICLAASFITFRSIENSKDSMKEALNLNNSDLADCFDRMNEILSKYSKNTEVLSETDHKNLNTELNYALMTIYECRLTSDQVYGKLKTADLKASHFYDFNITQVSDKPKQIDMEETPLKTEQYSLLKNKLTELKYKEIFDSKISPSDTDDQCMEKLLTASEIYAKTFVLIYNLRVMDY